MKGFLWKNTKENLYAQMYFNYLRRILKYRLKTEFHEFEILKTDLNCNPFAPRFTASLEKHIFPKENKGEDRMEASLIRNREPWLPESSLDESINRERKRADSPIFVFSLSDTMMNN